MCSYLLIFHAISYSVFVSLNRIETNELFNHLGPSNSDRNYMMQHITNIPDSCLSLCSMSAHVYACLRLHCGSPGQLATHTQWRQTDLCFWSNPLVDRTLSKPQQSAQFRSCQWGDRERKVNRRGRGGGPLMCAGDDDEWTRGRSHSGLSFTNRDSGDKQNQNIN